MSEEKTTNQVVALAGAFAIGAVFGAGLALLLAPASGKETREAIARKTRELKGKVVDTYEDTKEMISEKKAELLAAIQAGRQALKEESAKAAAEDSEQA